MKTLTAKNCILTIAQIPVLLMRLIVACLDWLLVKSIASLSNPLSQPFADRAEVQTKKNIAKGCDLDEHATMSIRPVLDLLNSLDDIALEKDRRVFESTEAGHRAVTTNPDRHLYAILRPNRAENLKRIENVFCEMDSATLNRVLRNTERILDTRKL